METKTVFKYFTIVNHEKEEEYLRSMHKDGWKLKKVSGFCMYHFEKCEPEDVIYRLDYNREGIRHKSEYTKMFEDCGNIYRIMWGIVTSEKQRQRQMVKMKFSVMMNQNLKC